MLHHSTYESAIIYDTVATPINFRHFAELCTKCYFSFKHCICIYNFMYAYFCFYSNLLSRVSMQCMHAERNTILASFRLSVRLSVCTSIMPVPVLCLNGWCRRNFWRSCRSIIRFLLHTAVTKCQREPPQQAR